MKRLPPSPRQPAPRRATAAMALAAMALAMLAACTEHAAPADPQAAPAAPAGVAMARGRIEVQGGLLELSPLQDGAVETLAVQEGQSVTRGQLLLRLSAAGAQAEAGVAQAELQLAEARQRARAQQLPALRRTATRLAEAAAAGAAEPQRAEEAEQALRGAESDLAVARAETDVARQRLAQLHARSARRELHAPEDGTVVRVATQVGQRLLSASGGPAAVTLLPRRPLVVRAEINESYAAAVQPGMRASITTDGDTAPTALPPARVVRMSPVLGAGRLQEDAQRGPVRVVECVLEFDQAPTQARPGQAVRVRFHP
ncbi:HlyD family efflux transporter periplasmic adaptor subunit [Acidovorax sp. NCPPB 2350]|nr:HlyD family efflux transporter periplasmic adaptor subunit [Acidovorax sp. NCPPB 2350]